MFFPFFDPTMIILIPGILLTLWAQMKVNGTFNKYSEVFTRQGVTAAQVARDILDRHHLSDVRIEYVHGHLSDHYDPRDKVVRLSDATYHSTSIAAIGVAAHEVGHAIQHDTAYVPLHMRNMIAPVANIGATAGPWIVILGLFFGRGWGPMIMDFGILLFSLAVGFYVITLPVEYNASSRAVAILETGGYMNQEEVTGAKKVLNAAALTYVAAAASAIFSLIRLLVLRGSRDDD